MCVSLYVSVWVRVLMCVVFVCHVCTCVCVCYVYIICMCVCLCITAKHKIRINLMDTESLL